MKENNIIVKSLDCIKISALMDEIIKEAELAKLECKKTSPCEAEICNHSFENLETIISKVEDCFLARYGSAINLYGAQLGLIIHNNI